MTIKPHVVHLDDREQEEIFNLHKSEIADNASDFSFTIYQPSNSDFFEYIRNGNTRIHLYLHDRSNEFIDLVILNEARPEPIPRIYSYPDNFMRLEIYVRRVK
mgnify:CR=1 FL=1